MIAIMLVIAAAIAGFIGLFIDPDSDSRIFVFIVFVVLLVMGLILRVLECAG